MASSAVVSDFLGHSSENPAEAAGDDDLAGFQSLQIKVEVIQGLINANLSRPRKGALVILRASLCLH